jgi:hypothetical protein
MKGMDSLLVLIGSDRIPDEALQPTLLIDAQADRLELLHQQASVKHNNSNLTWRQAVLADRSNTEVNWFHFNDGRLDGTVPLEHWLTIYPNLQLIGQEKVKTSTLADLLNDWPHAADNKLNIDLTVSQGDPLQILAGAGPWIERMGRIKLERPRAPEPWEESCDTWLKQQGFRPDPSNAQSWVLDSQTAKLIQNQLEAENRCIQYAKELHDMENIRSMLQKALHHVFPYATYRKLRPDLSEFTEPQLVDHFVAHGINEGINLEFSTMEAFVAQLEAEQSAVTSRLELLNEKSRHTAQQLEILKDLIARLMVKL